MAAALLENFIIDMETGQRGFLISGKEHFLAPYTMAKNTISAALQSIKLLVADDSAQLKRLDEIEVLIGRWQIEAGAIAINIKTQGAGGPQRYGLFSGGFRSRRWQRNT